MSQLSVVVITKNEESAIKLCLTSVAWADEIILVDDESEDATIEIVQQFSNVRVFVKKMTNGFGPQKQYGLDKAKGEWVLSLDADERVTEAGRQEIEEAMRTAAHAGFFFRRRNRILGQDMDDRSAGNLRLFKRTAGRFSLVGVHEEVLVEGRVGTMNEPILHVSRNMASIENLLNMTNRYSSLSAAELHKRGRRVSLHNSVIFLCCYPIYIFARLFLIHGHWRYGVRGFILACMRALEGLMNHLKLWELQSNEHRKILNQ